MESRRRSRAFTLVELLVVISIIAILIGILLPTVTRARRQTVKVVCTSNLRQLGQAMVSWMSDHNGFFPEARHMPKPFLSTLDLPPLPQLLAHQIAPGWPKGGRDQLVFQCPGDADVYDRAHTSYQYEVLLGGDKIDNFIAVKVMDVPPSMIWILRDFDGGIFDLTNGTTLAVPFFHGKRNLLFADGAVGNFPMGD